MYRVNNILYVLHLVEPETQAASISSFLVMERERECFVIDAAQPTTYECIYLLLNAFIIIAFWSSSQG